MSESQAGSPVNPTYESWSSMTTAQIKTWATINEADIATCEHHGNPAIRAAGKFLRLADSAQNRGDIPAAKQLVADAAHHLNNSVSAPFAIRY